MGGHPRRVPAIYIDTTMPRSLVTTTEAARYLKVSRMQAHRYMKSGQLQCVKVGRMQFTTRTWIAQFLQRKAARAVN